MFVRVCSAVFVVLLVLVGSPALLPPRPVLQVRVAEEVVVVPAAVEGFLAAGFVGVVEDGCECLYLPLGSSAAFPGGVAVVVPGGLAVCLDGSSEECSGHEFDDELAPWSSVRVV